MQQLDSRHIWHFLPHALPEVQGADNARPCTLQGYRKTWGRVPVASPHERYVGLQRFDLFEWMGEAFVEPAAGSSVTGVAVRVSDQALAALSEQYPLAMRHVVTDVASDWSGARFGAPVIAFQPTDLTPPPVVSLAGLNRALELAAAWNAVAPGFSDAFVRELALGLPAESSSVGRVAWGPDFSTLWLSQEGVAGKVCLLRVSAPLTPSRLSPEFTLEWSSPTTPGWEEFEARTPITRQPRPTSPLAAALQDVRRGVGLNELAAHPCWLVRLAVAGNARVSPEVTPDLVKDPDPWVQSAVRAVLRARLRA